MPEPTSGMRSGSDGDLGARSSLISPRYKERGALCRLTPIEGYTGPFCSCFWRDCDTCAACQGDPEAHDLHVCGQYPEQVTG